MFNLLASCGFVLLAAGLSTAQLLQVSLLNGQKNTSASGSSGSGTGQWQSNSNNSSSSNTNNNNNVGQSSSQWAAGSQPSSFTSTDDQSSSNSQSWTGNQQWYNNGDSLVRQNYNQEDENIINNLINNFTANSYTYLSMQAYFDRADVALHGIAMKFKKLSEKAAKHMEKLVTYQNLRGGRVILSAIPAMQTEWPSALDAFTTALNIEKGVMTLITQAQITGVRNGDPQLGSFLVDHFITKQFHLIKMLAEHVRDLRRVGSGLGEYEVDQDLEEKLRREHKQKKSHHKKPRKHDDYDEEEDSCKEKDW